jgi:hypothetical protein
MKAQQIFHRLLNLKKAIIQAMTALADTLTGAKNHNGFAVRGDQAFVFQFL